MAYNFKTFAAILTMAGLITTSMTGCNKPEITENSEQFKTSNTLLNTSAVSQNSEVSTNPDQKPESSSEPVQTQLKKADCTIGFSDDGADISGDGVKADGTEITINKTGVYSLSGSCSDGRIIVDAGKNDNVTLMLNGLKLTNTKGSVIDCENADKLVLYTVGGTENTLSDSNYTSEDPDAPDSTVFSRTDMIITGEGSLTVNGLFSDGIKSKDGLIIESGNIRVNSVDDGIIGRDYVAVQGGTVTVDANGDGIKSTNDTDNSKGYITITDKCVLDITSENDGIQAESTITVNGGTIKISAGGKAADAEVKQNENPFDRDRTSTGTVSNAESNKGLKAKSDIKISGGNIDIKSADDSIHSNANVAIDGGTFTLSSCDDGIHADESLQISDGIITIVKSYEGLEGKNIDIIGGTIEVNSADDGLNAAGGDNGEFFGYTDDSIDYYISISGGDITVNSEGDGIDSNGTVAQSGGNVTVYGPTMPDNGALDYEKSFAVSGGTLMAFGSLGMAQAPDTLSQPCLSIYAQAQADSTIEVRDENSNVILTTVIPKPAESLIFSSDKFKIDTNYGIYANNELLATVTAQNGISGGGANGNGFGNGGGFGGRQRPGGFGERAGFGEMN